MSQTLSTARRATPGRMKWRLAAGAVVALVVGTLWRAEEAPPTPEPPEVSLTGSAPVTFAPPSAGLSDGGTELAALKAELSTAAIAIDRSLGPPVEGPVRQRPDYVSPMEWMVLQGVANQHDNPEQELSHLVHFLRFNKQRERWESLPAASEPTLRRALAASLLADLPVRVRQGDLSPADARALLMRLLPDAEADAGRQEARLAEAMAGIEAGHRAAQASAAPAPSR